MTSAPAEVERNIRNVVEGEKVTASIRAIDYTSIFPKKINAI